MACILKFVLYVTGGRGFSIKVTTHYVEIVGMLYIFHVTSVLSASGVELCQSRVIELGVLFLKCLASLPLFSSTGRSA